MSQNREELLLENDLYESFKFQKKLNGFTDDQNERIQYIALTTHSTYLEIVDYVRSFSSTCSNVNQNLSASDCTDSAILSAEKHFF